MNEVVIVWSWLAALIGGADMPTDMRVVSGRTVVVAEERVRLVGFETPRRRSYCPAEARLGERARLYLEARIRLADRLELVPVGGGGEDGPARAVMLIDGRDAADIMIRSGLARPEAEGPRAVWC